MGTESRLRIAIVDDSAFARKCVRTVLGASYDYVEIQSVLDVRSSLEREKPDLVLMDVNMPGVNGDRLTEVMQRSSSMRHRCPIVLFSDTPEPQLASMARACGAAGFVRKTPDFVQLKRAVELHLGKSGATGEA